MKKDLTKKIAWLKRDKYKNFDIQSRRIKAKLNKDIMRIKNGEPLDYVIGWKDFLGCKIDLSYRPLIPREETEFWVGEVIKEACEVGLRAPRSTTSHTRAAVKILDLFAGSGCIGLAVLKHCPNVDVTFSDKEENSLKQIRKNLKINRLEGEVVQSDIFYNIKDKFDIIFANPPYIPTKKQKVQKSVKDWEPHQALYSGADGLTIIKNFLQKAKKHLNLEGKIYLEFGYGQKGAIEKLLKQNNYKKWQFHRDQFGKWRWVKFF